MRGAPSFYDVLTEAVGDFVDRGYVDNAQLAYWLQRLRDAAGGVLADPAQLEAALRRTFADTYGRLVGREQLLRDHRGISRFTLQRVSPALRRELDRRIMASADLIKLNRENAINDTLQRFSGWATSIPAGGSDAVARNATKQHIRKNLAQLPFRERRILIDQGHKFTANLSNILALEGGALALIWHSHWRQPGYNYRRDHKERDLRVYAIRGNWALERGLMKAGPAGYYDQVTAVGEEVFCLPGNSLIAQSAHQGRIEAAYRRSYNGDLVRIFTRKNSLAATPNHPVLTTKGWVAIGALQQGDQVFEIADHFLDVAKYNDKQRVSLISDVFGALRKFGVSEMRCGQFQQFHGDGSPSDVEIVRPAGELTFSSYAGCYKSGGQFRLAVPDHFAAAVGASGGFFDRCVTSGSGPMGGFDQAGSTFDALACHANMIGRASSADRAACIPDTVNNDFAGDPVALGERQNAFASLMQIAKPTFVDHVYRERHQGHVYNLQTETGWYVANGIVTHNCRCYATYLYALRQLPADMLTTRGRAELANIRLVA